MTGFKRAFPFMLYLIPFAAMAFVQSTAIILPTNDDTSAFVVENANNTTVFSAAGDGDIGVSGDADIAGAIHANELTTDNDANIAGTLNAHELAITDDAVIGGSVNATSFVGDGSTLSNVRPIVEFEGGELNFELIPNAWIVKTVRITVPSAGRIIVNAVGCAEFKSTEKQMYRASITTGSTLDFSYLIAGSKQAGPDNIDNVDTFGAIRKYWVTSPGTYEYNLVANKVGGNIALRDVCMTATFFPAAGADAYKAVPVEELSSAPVSGGSGPLDQP